MSTMSTCTLVLILVTISYAQEEIIWSTPMDNVDDNGEGWLVLPTGNRCHDVGPSNVCLSGASCFRFKGTCRIERQSNQLISTAGYNNIYLKYLVVESSNRGLEDADQFIISYSCTNDNIFTTLKIYDSDPAAGVDNFEYIGGATYTTANILALAISDPACNNNANGINIKFHNTGSQNNDRVSLDAVSIVGTPIPNTPVPTASTPAPTSGTPAPTAQTPAPTDSTPAPSANTPAPTDATPSPTMQTSEPSAFPTPGPTTTAPTPDTPAPVTASPTDATPSPTDSTPAPSDNTPSPTGSTPSPTDTTPSPTDTTPSPTDTTPSPTDSTPSPTGSTPSPTPIPTDNTPAPAVANTPPPTFFAPTLGTINCGETVTATLGQGAHVYYTVELDSSYDALRFDGCGSNFDIDLMFYSNGIQEAQDDSTGGGRGGCGHQWATLLDVGGADGNNFIAISGKYTLGIGSYLDNSGGTYDVVLTCSGSLGTPAPTDNTPAPVTAAPTPPTPAPTYNPTVTCARHRREWSTLTDEEQQHYVDAFILLGTQAQGSIVQAMSNVHGTQFSNGIHQAAQFWPWHRQYLFDLETRIRNLGVVNGHDYSCFSLPYWDWSVEPTPGDDEDPELVTSVPMGGDPNGGCVWSSNIYDPASGTCLRRSIDYENDVNCAFVLPPQIMNDIDNNPTYAAMRPLFEAAPHSRPHICIGDQMSGINSPDDPMFYLHHGMVDYVWALWQVCNNYAGDPNIDGSMYSGNDLDNDLIEYPGVTVRDVMDIAAMGYSYEKGPFWDAACVLGAGNCAANTIPPTWFKDTGYTPIEANSDCVPESNRRRLKHKGGKHKTPKYKGRKRKTSNLDRMSRSIRRSLKEQGYGKKELLNKWSIKTCEYEQKQMGDICKMPEYFEDCSNMEINEKTYDIDITLQQLLNKKGLNECMKETRIRYYEWAKNTNSLLSLCDGCYDRFCDMSSLRNKCIRDGNTRYNTKFGHIQSPLNPININIIHQFKFVIIIGAMIGLIMIFGFIICCNIKHKKYSYNKVIKNIDYSDSDDTDNEEDDILNDI